MMIDMYDRIQHGTNISGLHELRSAKKNEALLSKTLRDNADPMRVATK